MTEGHKSFTLAADNETEMQDWLNKLHSVLQQNKLQEDTRAASLERSKSFLLFMVNRTDSLELIFVVFVLFSTVVKLKCGSCIVWHPERFGSKHESAINEVWSGDRFINCSGT